MTEIRKGGEPRSMALVSGKGGSGKTLVAAGLAMLLGNEIARFGQQVILMDGDPVTAGLSYYLGLKQLRRRNLGFYDFAAAAEKGHQLSATSLVQPIEQLSDGPDVRCQILPVGAHNRLLRDIDQKHFPQLLGQAVELLKETGEWVIVDCRGGIDDESLAICDVVDEILLVVEPDVTSLQSSQHLVDVLIDHDLGHKLVGFVVNKAFEDPSVLRQSASGLFRTECLATIPFDVDTARATLIGDLPPANSLFMVNLEPVLPELVPGSSPERSKPLTPWGLAGVEMRSPERGRGGAVLNFLLLAAGGAIALRAATGGRPDLVLILSIIGLTLFGALAGSSSVRQLLGRSVRKTVGRRVRERQVG